MKSSGFIRHLLLGTLLIALVTAIAAPAAHAQHGDEMTLEQMKMKLRDEGRNISQLTHAELDMIKATEGNMFTNLFNTEYVMKVGTSTFIMYMPTLTILVSIAFIVVLGFFTPVGLFIFRGGLHAVAGGFLSITGLSKNFGENLQKHPKKYLKEEKSVRAAFAKYMHNDFIPEYKNNVTAIAFMGTAFLIFSIGIRGVKFMTAHEPTVIIAAILIEITVLMLLGLTTWYEKEIPEEEGGGAGIPGKQLSLADVERRLDALKNELEASVRTDTGLRQ